MTDVTRLPDPMAALARLPRGSGIILRHTSPAQLQALAAKTIPLCRQRGIMCLIAGDWRLAARVGADGVHLAEHTARAGLLSPVMMWLRHQPRVLTVAAHNAAALRRGAALGADAVVLAPVFPTASHPDTRPLGAVRFAALVRRAISPVIALGGVSPRTVNGLKGSRAYGVAGIGWAVK